MMRPAADTSMDGDAFGDEDDDQENQPPAPAADAVRTVCC